MFYKGGVHKKGHDILSGAYTAMKEWEGLKL